MGWGVRGKLGGWDSDLSLVYGSNKVAYGVEDSLNTSYGAASQMSFDAGAMKYDQFVFNAGIVRDFEVGSLPEGVNVAFGIEARRESYGIEAGEPASYNRGPVVGAPAGAQGFPGFQPSNELDEEPRGVRRLRRRGGASSPRNSWRRSRCAARTIRTSAPRSPARSPARYDFTDAFALRGAVSTGFRAPGLQQEFFTSTATNFINGVPFEVGTFPATSDVAITLGAQPLDAEESVNYSLGTVLRFGGFEATIDAYRIDIDDRIVLSENLNTPQVAALISPFGATVARFFINGVETKTEGIDLVTRYLLAHREHRHVRIHRRRQLERHGSRKGAVDQCHRQHLRWAACALHAAGAVRAHQHAELRRRHARQQGEPRSRLEHAARAARSFGVNLKGTRYGEVVEPGVPTAAEINAGVPDARDLHIQPDWIVDLALNTRLMDDKLGFALGVGQPVRPVSGPCAECARRAHAARRNRNLNATNALGYSRYSPYGFSGRFCLRPHVFQLVDGAWRGRTVDGPAFDRHYLSGWHPAAILRQLEFPGRRNRELRAPHPHGKLQGLPVSSVRGHYIPHSDADEPPRILPAALSHHERRDARGGRR